MQPAWGHPISLPTDFGGHIGGYLRAVRMPSNDPQAFVPASGRRFVGVQARLRTASENGAYPLHRFQYMLGHGPGLNRF